VKPAAFGLGLILLALPFASKADESLVARREACRQEARARIAPKGKIGVDGYRRIVERRNAYVSQCMTRVLVAQKEPSLPPKRVFDATTRTHQASVSTPVKNKSRRIAERAERRKLKQASAMTPKSKKFRGQKPKRIARKNK
jgi:hypothetical protein